MILSLSAILIAATISACGDRDNTAPLIASAIVITTQSDTSPVTGTMQFTAVVTDASGHTIALAPTWSVANGGGTITQDGLFTAGDSAGVFVNTVVATSGAVSSASTVTVIAGALATIAVTPGTISLAASTTQRFVAVGKDAHGNVVSITDRVWSIAALGGTIDTAGVFTAGTTAGTFTSTITATSGTISGTASVTVMGGPLTSITLTPLTVTLAIGATQQYTVVGHDASNNIVPVSPTPVWSVVAGGGAIDANGLFTAGLVSGTFGSTIHVMSGLICADASVTIAAGSLATITVSPSTTTLAAGATQEFTAVGKDAHNNTVVFTPTWSVVASGGTINGTSGVFTAGTTAGIFLNTVEATSGAISGTSSVTVQVGALASIVVSPATTTLSIGQTQQFTAVGKDANHNVVEFTPTWSVVASGGTINSSTGVFTAGTVAGVFTSTVRATSGEISSTSSVTVSPGAVATITVSPATVSLMVGATQQYTAVAHDANNNVVVITPAWSVSGGGGTIDPITGLYTAGSTAGTFNSSVIAMSGMVSGMASVIVTPAVGPLATITISPPLGFSFLFGPIQFTATGHDAGGAVVPITPVWSVSSPALGSISQTGFFVATGIPGTYLNSIFATSGSIVGSAGFTVSCQPICF